MSRREIVEQLTRIVRQQSPDAKIILYGSEARGDSRPDSDIDVLILVEKEKITLEEEEQISLPIYLLELNTGILISPRIQTRKSWENQPFKTPFYINVVNEGIEL
ncbi:MAG: nucleotidyltransferase domain-containing protein [Paludibacter sp.]